MRRIMLGPHARSNDCGFASPWRCALPGGHGAVPSVLNRFGIPSGFEAGLQLNIAWNAADGGGPHAARTVLGWKSGPIVLELLACPRLLTEARFARCFAALVSRRGFRPCCSAACRFNVEIGNVFGTLSRTDRESKKTCSQDCAKAVRHDAIRSCRPIGSQRARPLPVSRSDHFSRRPLSPGGGERRCRARRNRHRPNPRSFAARNLTTPGASRYAALFALSCGRPMISRASAGVAGSSPNSRMMRTMRSTSSTLFASRPFE
jgi:hypothetical protein